MYREERMNTKIRAAVMAALLLSLLPALAAAGAIVLCDRLISAQRLGARPVVPGGPVGPLPAHVFGEPVWRRKQRRRSAGEN